MERPAWAPRRRRHLGAEALRASTTSTWAARTTKVDREAARRAMEFVPDSPRSCRRTGPSCAARSAPSAVDQGSPGSWTGSGIPTFGNVHEVAQAASPAPASSTSTAIRVAVAHSQARPGRQRARAWPRTCSSRRTSLSQPPGGRLLDLDRPVALLLVAILHFSGGWDDPYGAVGAVERDWRPAACWYWALCLEYEGLPLGRSGRGERWRRLFKDIRNPLIMRSRDEIARFFEGSTWWNPDWCRCRTGGRTPRRRTKDPYAFSGFAAGGGTA
ncbi:S-adenosyl methyltransferase OS=Streptomyces glaucescens OX=1907 GN=SGLAU_29285 PE=4 SV=1 [Streptomyces glaucescens]